MTYTELVEQLTRIKNLPKIYNKKTMEDITEEYYKAEYNFLIAYSEYVYNETIKNLRKMMSLQSIFDNYKRLVCIGECVKMYQ